MTFLIISLAALLVAPLLYHGVQRVGANFAYIEKVLFVLVVALVVLQILPESYELAGWPALALAVVGWWLPSVMERSWRTLSHGIHNIPIFLAVVGLGLHEMLDGVALSLGSTDLAHGMHVHEHEMHSLPMAIVLHRYPTALFLWWLLKPRYGVKKSAVIFALLGICTIIGFVEGHWLFELFGHGKFLGYFQALVGGSLLHLAGHQVGAEHDHDHGHGHHH
jgi:uncharacterized protein